MAKIGYIKAALLVGAGYVVGYNMSVKQMRSWQPGECPQTLQDQVGQELDMKACVKELEHYGIQFKDGIDEVMKGLYFHRIDEP